MSERRPGNMINVLQLAGVSSIAVGGTNVVYSRSFPLNRNVTYSWDVKLASPGVINVKVEFEQGWARPTTEGSADSTHFCVPDNKTSTPMFSAITDANLHNTSYSPNATPYGRFKFTGLNSGTTNDAGTTVTVAQVHQLKNG